MLLETEYPFSVRFGLADSRKNCIASSARVYQSLVRRQREATTLKFSTLSAVAVDPNDGSIDVDKLKLLLKVFRPNKEKELTLVDFTRAVDNVYRELKTLSAAVRNASASKSVLRECPRS